MRSATAASISRNDIFSNGSTGLTTTGLVFAAAGKSHSPETPTSWSPRPRAKIISVAAGKNEMRRSSVIHKNVGFPIARGGFQRVESSRFVWQAWKPFGFFLVSHLRPLCNFVSRLATAEANVTIVQLPTWTRGEETFIPATDRNSKMLLAK